MKSILLVQLATSLNSARQTEYDSTLAENRASGFFEHVEALQTGEHRPSFCELFKLANDRFPARTVVLANSDIVFSESIRLADNIHEGEVYALARWENATDRHGFDRTQDVWVFRTPLPVIPAHYPLGLPGCDNRIAAQFAEAGFRVLNPSNSIRCYHRHASRVRSYKQTDRIRGDYLNVRPDWLNLVSFSLFGTDPKYLRGALENARQVPLRLPGWRPIFYVDATVPADVLREIEHAGALVREGTIANPYLYRLQALVEPHVARVLFRDADSRITDREVEAVRGWIASRKPFHSMRDHPHHTRPLMGGMWGAIAWELPQSADILASVPASRRFDDDQKFLEARVWPVIRERTLEHDFCRGTFPRFHIGEGFVGERIGVDGQPIPHDRAVRSRWISTCTN